MVRGWVTGRAMQRGRTGAACDGWCEIDKDWWMVVSHFVEDKLDYW